MTIDNLQFFTQDLEADNDKILTLKKEDPSYLIFVEELLWVNKLLTIEKYLSIKSKFKQNLFRNKITDSLSQADELGIIYRWGIKMTPNEFEEFLNLYQELYEV